MRQISQETYQAIKNFLDQFLEELVQEYKARKLKEFETAKEYLTRSSSQGRLKPFQSAMIPIELLLINEFERGLSTRLGNTFEECARLLALDYHKTAIRQYNLTTQVSRSAYAEAEKQKEYYEHLVTNKSEKISFNQMAKRVVDAGKTNDLETVTLRVDLYVISQDGKEYFFEMKAPKPNKGQCLEVTQRLLRIHAIKQKLPPQINSYYAMSYNPYGSLREDYKWSYARNYMPFDDMVLIGEEFWNLIGGESAFEQLLNIYREVGEEKRKYLIEALAFHSP